MKKYKKGKSRNKKQYSFISDEVIHPLRVYTNMSMPVHSINFILSILCIADIMHNGLKHFYLNIFIFMTLCYLSHFMISKYFYHMNNCLSKCLDLLKKLDSIRNKRTAKRIKKWVLNSNPMTDPIWRINKYYGLIVYTFSSVYIYFLIAAVTSDYWSLLVLLFQTLNVAIFLLHHIYNHMSECTDKHAQINNILHNLEDVNNEKI